jgi:hypothetical protein
MLPIFDDAYFQAGVAQKFYRRSMPGEYRSAIVRGVEIGGKGG